MDAFLLIFFILIGYLFILFFLKKLGFGKKINCEKCNNCCPDCKSALNRIQRSKIDYLFLYITFQVFDFRRYSCKNCAWEGLKWEKKFKPGNN